MRRHPRNRGIAYEWRPFGAGDVVLDRFPIDGSRDFLFERKHDRLGAGGLAAGGHARLELERRFCDAFRFWARLVESGFITATERKFGSNHSGVS